MKALELGYNHVDTAKMYETYCEIGQALQEVDRAIIFVTSKVPIANNQVKFHPLLY